MNAKNNEWMASESYSVPDLEKMTVPQIVEICEKKYMQLFQKGHQATGDKFVHTISVLTTRLIEARSHVLNLIAGIY